LVEIKRLIRNRSVSDCTCHQLKADKGNNDVSDPKVVDNNPYSLNNMRKKSGILANAGHSSPASSPTSSVQSPTVTNPAGSPRPDMCLACKSSRFAHLHFAKWSDNYDFVGSLRTLYISPMGTHTARGVDIPGGNNKVGTPMMTAGSSNSSGKHGRNETENPLDKRIHVSSSGISLASRLRGTQVYKQDASVIPPAIGGGLSLQVPVDNNAADKSGKLPGKKSKGTPLSSVLDAAQRYPDDYFSAPKQNNRKSKSESKEEAETSSNASNESGMKPSKSKVDDSGPDVLSPEFIQRFRSHVRQNNVNFSYSNQELTDVYINSQKFRELLENPTLENVQAAANLMKEHTLIADILVYELGGAANASSGPGEYDFNWWLRILSAKMTIDSTIRARLTT
jgi:hypothetical protein